MLARRDNTLLLVLLACQDPTALTPNCDAPCYDGPIDTLFVGACRPGKLACDPAGRPIACVGQVVPTAEICNGVDDDCLGDEEHLALFDDPRTNLPCGYPPVGECQPGVTTCVEGVVFCVGAVLPREERCDPRRDYDCDGVPGNPKPRGFCGDVKWASSSPCRPGIEVCSGDSWICLGAVTPQSSDLCDETNTPVDADCDGLISIGAVDIILIVDRSGSMDAYLFYALPIVRAWLRALHAQTFRAALIIIPDLSDTTYTLYPYDTPAAVAARLDPIPSHGAHEPTLDAIRAATLLPRRANARRLLLLLQDEPVQGRAGPIELGDIEYHVFTNDASQRALAERLNGRAHDFADLTPELLSSLTPPPCMM